MFRDERGCDVHPHLVIVRAAVGAYVVCTYMLVRSVNYGVLAEARVRKRSSLAHNRRVTITCGAQKRCCARATRVI